MTDTKPVTSFEIREANEGDSFDVFIDGEFVPWHVWADEVIVQQTEVTDLKIVTFSLLVEGDVSFSPRLHHESLGEARTKISRQE